jgi:DNA repair exonuclease SbcCD ATPase subunit
MDSCLSDLQKQVTSRLALLQQRVGVRDDLLSRLKTKNDSLTSAETAARLAKQAAVFVESSVKNTRLEVLHDLETIVNAALVAVYDTDPPRFELELSSKRDRTAIVPWFSQTVNGQTLRRRYEGLGCGVSDVVSMALRLVLIRASGADTVVIADEPFRFLGVLQVPNAALLLKEIARKLSIQVIMTTHWDAPIEIADRAFLLTKTDGTVDIQTKGD